MTELPDFLINGSEVLSSYQRNMDVKVRTVWVTWISLSNSSTQLKVNQCFRQEANCWYRCLRSHLLVNSSQWETFDRSKGISTSRTYHLTKCIPTLLRDPHCQLLTFILAVKIGHLTRGFFWRNPSRNTMISS
jgi:hypothetical protein